MSDSSKPKPTITQTTRPLPFDQLPWDDFERLCLMLLPRMGFENPQHYGAAGGERGRDIVAHRDGELWYVQCKQVKQCGPKVLLDEIEKVQGLMADEPDLRPAGLLFIASCDVSATARDRASKRCKELSLACEIWGRTDLDACVQPHSDIAATFFGPYVLPSPPKVYHNLPQPDFGTFIGREEELAQVHRILRPYPHSQHALVAIDGVGGIGKSALALAVAHRYLRDYDHLSPEERFEAIVWTSAQPTVLTADGIAPCLRVTRTLGDIYTTISVTLEREDVTRARPEEQNELVRRALTRKRTLLVVDNLEAVDDERVSSFLRDLPVPTKSVVTTRHRIDAAYSVHLTGMPKDDVLALIAQETAKKGVTLGEDEAEELWNRTGGVPLAIVWSVAQMGFGSGVEDVLPRLRQPTEDIPRFCFERAIEHIRGTDAHKLLVALALFATSASREALVHVGGLGTGNISRCDPFVTLERLSLVNRSRKDRFWMLPLTREYAIATSLPDIPTITHFRNRQAEYYLEHIPRPASFQPYTKETVDRVRSELLNILDLLEWCEEQKNLRYLVELFLRIHGLLGVFGYLNRREYWGDRAIQAAEALESVADLGILYAFTMGWVAIRREERARARHLLKKGLECIKQSGDREAECLALRYLGRLEVAEQNADQALRIYQDALSMAVTEDFRAVAASINSDLAYWQMRYGSLEDAERCIRAAIVAFEDLNDIVRASDRTIMLANILVLQERYSEAEEQLIPSLERLEQEVGQPDGIVPGYACLAHIYAQRGDLDKAKQCCKHARRICGEVGIREGAFPIGLPEVCQQR